MGHSKEQMAGLMHSLCYKFPDMLARIVCPPGERVSTTIRFTLSNGTGELKVWNVNELTLWLKTGFHFGGYAKKGWINTGEKKSAVVYESHGNTDTVISGPWEDDIIQAMREMPEAVRAAMVQRAAENEVKHLLEATAKEAHASELIEAYTKRNAKK